MKEELQLKIAGLIKKWKDKKPEKFSDLYWRYRADQNLYLVYKKKLDSFLKRP